LPETPTHLARPDPDENRYACKDPFSALRVNSNTSDALPSSKNGGEDRRFTSIFRHAPATAATRRDWPDTSRSRFEANAGICEGFVPQCANAKGARRLRPGPPRWFHSSRARSRCARPAVSVATMADSKSFVGGTVLAMISASVLQSEGCRDERFVDRAAWHRNRAWRPVSPASRLRPRPRRLCRRSRARSPCVESGEASRQSPTRGH